jgi:hypothetical protein
VNCKAKGTRLERKTFKMLQSAGYQCIRSAASLGAFDIIAMNPLGIRCIQIKANAWPGPVEREGLREAAKGLPPNACVECWRWNDNAGVPLIRLLDEFEFSL